MRSVFTFSFFVFSGLFVQAQNVGIGTSTPKAQLDVNGSFGTAITSLTTGTLTLTSSHATVLASPGTAITLPTAASAEHRIYTIIYYGTTGAAVSVASPSTNIITAGGTATASTSITGGSVNFQSNGTNWYAEVKAPSSSGNGYIQNQTATAQSAGYNISGNATVGGNQNVTGTSTIGGSETVTGNSSVGGTTTLTGAVTANNNLSVAGTSTLTGAVTTGNNLSVAGTSTIGGSETVTNNISVGGISTLTGAVTNAALAGTGVRFVTTDATGKLVSGVSTTAGITNANLANSSITITPGTGLSGGGTVALGGTTTLTNTGVTSLVAGSGISVSGATGAVTLSVAAGNGSYIQNGTTQQASSNFNVSGAGVVGTTMTAGTFMFPPPTGDPSPVITARTVPTGQGAAPEKTELILFHSNDNATGGSGPDLITLRAPAIRLQTYADPSVADINNNAGSNDRLYIAPDGKVGIGTSAPGDLFHVYGAEGPAIPGTGVFLSGGLSGNSKIELRGGLPYIDFASGATGDNEGRLILMSANKLNFDNTSVGIGTSPSAQFHTTGTVRFNNYVNGMLGSDASGNLQTRVITGTPNQMDVVNGDGVAGNPTVNINNTYTADVKSNTQVTGGGTVTYKSGVLNWTNRFIIISNGSGTHYTNNGYYDITVPQNVTITGVGGAGNVAVTTNGVPLGGWQALYYILTPNTSNVTNNANFRIASYTAGLVVPESWVMIGVVNGDDGSVRLGNGITLGANQSYNSATGTAGAASGNTWTGSADIVSSRDDINSSGSSSSVPAGVALPQISTSACDDCVYGYNLPFNFVINGTSYNWVGLSTNGYIQFNTSNSFTSTFSNTTLPSGTFSTPVLCYYWDDMESTGNLLRYGTFGDAGNRTFILDFELRTHATGNFGVAGQVQLHEGSNLINVRYPNGTTSPYACGQYATIGFQMSSSSAIPISCNTKVLDDNTACAISFSPVK